MNLLGDANDASLVVITNFVKGIEMEAASVGLGKPATDVWPEDARIYMSKDQKGVKLSSLLGTTRNMMIANRALRELVEEHCKGVEIEYLPFALYDHRKRLYSTDYCIINPIGTLDCLDVKKTDADWDDEKPGRMSYLEVPVLDRKKVAKAPQLFRIKESPTDLIVGPELGVAIGKAKLTNVRGTKLKFGDEV
jgi:hypothetical protein